MAQDKNDSSDEYARDGEHQEGYSGTNEKKRKWSTADMDDKRVCKRPKPCSSEECSCKKPESDPGEE